MPTITCSAAHSFSAGAIPCPYEWMLISDENIGHALDKIIELTRAGEEDFEVTAEVLIRSYGYPAYICPKCGRLLVFESGRDKPATSYGRE